MPSPKTPTPPTPADKLVFLPDGTTKSVPLTKAEKDDIAARFQEHLDEQAAREAPSRDMLVNEALAEAQADVEAAQDFAALKAAVTGLVGTLSAIFGPQGETP